MKLINLSTIILILIVTGVCQAQSVIISEVDPRGFVQDRFVAEFAPDYALFNQNGAGLIRKGDEWSLVKLRNIQGLSLDGKAQKKMHVFKRVIPETLARKIMTESAPDSVFSIGQERFDSLPETCQGKSGQKEGIAGGISDAGTVMIWEYTPETKRMIQFYGAESYYITCYPYQPEFGILGPLLNTFTVLEKYVRRGY